VFPHQHIIPLDLIAFAVKNTLPWPERLQARRRREQTQLLVHKRKIRDAIGELNTFLEHGRISLASNDFCLLTCRLSSHDCQRRKVRV
jgi:hypothetical protein